MPPHSSESLPLCRAKRGSLDDQVDCPSPWWGRERTRATWYEPFQEQSDIDAAVHWALARPGIFLASVGDIHLIPKVLDAASRFVSAPGDETMEEQRTRLEMLPLFV